MSFGSVVRESHSSKKFYNSKLFRDFKMDKNIEYVENPIPENDLNRLYCKSSEIMDEVPDNSVHLMITSPPYNVGKEYDNDLTLDEYLSLLTTVFAEVHKNSSPEEEHASTLQTLEENHTFHFTQ